MKFKLTVEIKKDEHINAWRIYFYIHNVRILIPMFFIDGYDIHQNDEDGIFQTFKFNAILLVKVGEMLRLKEINEFINQNLSYDLYHYFFHSGFTNQVHPLYQANTYFKLVYEGTQEQIYQKVKEVEEKYLKNFIENNKNSNSFSNEYFASE